VPALAITERDGRAHFGVRLIPRASRDAIAGVREGVLHVRVTAAPVVVLVAAPADGPDGVCLEAELVDPHTGRLAEDATGSVVFSAGSTTVASVDLVAGHARTVVNHLPAGRLQVAFAGDPEHAAATGTCRERVAGM